jgi:hypothetical protein
MQPVREEALLEIEPHALDGIELRRVGRRGHERDVGRHAERARVMPAGLIKHHDDVLIVGDGGSEAVEELLHRLGVGIKHDEGKAVVGAGLNASKDVGECEALVAEPRWALAALPPDMAGPTLLADARLVLEEQSDALVFMCRPAAAAPAIPQGTPGDDQPYTCSHIVDVRNHLIHQRILMAY